MAKKDSKKDYNRWTSSGGFKVTSPITPVDGAKLNKDKNSKKGDAKGR